MNKNTRIALAGLVTLVLAGGVYFFAFANKSKAPVAPLPTPQQNVILKLKPEDIGLVLTPSTDGKKLTVTAVKVSDVKSLEYEVTYEADTPPSEMVEGAEDRVQRGFTDEAEINGKSPYESKAFDLGSCSKNVCRYDTGIEKIDVLMKVVKMDGKMYEVTDAVSLR